MQRKAKSSGFDFYETPAWAVEALLKRETFTGGILEPCSGRGAISRVLEGHGYAVASSDIRRDVDIYGEGGVDFLRREEPVDNVVTNPPFNQAEAMVRHALGLTQGKVAFFHKLSFLESKPRYSLFQQTPLHAVYVFSQRVQLFNPRDPRSVGASGIGGCLPFAWFVWEQGYAGEPVIRWILEKAETPQLALAEVA